MWSGLRSISILRNIEAKICPITINLAKAHRSAASINDHGAYWGPSTVFVLNPILTTQLIEYWTLALHFVHNHIGKKEYCN